MYFADIITSGNSEYLFRTYITCISVSKCIAVFGGEFPYFTNQHTGRRFKENFRIKQNIMAEKEIVVSWNSLFFCYAGNFRLWNDDKMLVEK